MIPKIIHYCWVGNTPKPQSVLYCIESWKKNCPDYEIREWNESNYDFTKNVYMRQAYESRKWGFVPDYARLDIIYQFGGIYLDTDVEILRSFDELLEQKAFMGFENTGDGEFFVNCGHGFGAEPHNKIILAARDLYDHVQFLKEDGTYQLLPSPHYTTQILKKYGLQQENRDQNLPEMRVYASDVLCPKNFRTGKIQKTDRTVSVHHFSASWMDEEIRTNLIHEQKLEKYVGKKGAKNILFLESVWKKYAGIPMVTKLPQRLVQREKAKLIRLWESFPAYEELLKAQFAKNGEGNPVLLDPAYDGDNTGDQIIMENCMLQLSQVLQLQHGLKEKCAIHIPTHRTITDKERDVLLEAKIKILCGTNALSGHMRTYGLWKMDPAVKIYRNTILMGVGFDSDHTTFDRYTRCLFQTILSSEHLHSVRDTFSEQMLRSMGVKNVIYTGCPTMWNITQELCAGIPREKAKDVVCTLTDYSRSLSKDQAMIDILSACYEKVFLWPQGKEDPLYFKQIRRKDNVEVIPPGLASYDRILELEKMDYVGTRLHAGIRALCKGHRTIIIAVDNRARNIGKDTGLPVIERDDIEILLQDKINSEFATNLQIPVNNIKRWKSQFLSF